MFKRKKCENCGEKINKSYAFCPYCRVSLKDTSDFVEDERNFGLLGKNDLMPYKELGLPGGFNTLFKLLMKNLNKQFKEFENIDNKSKKTGIKKSGIGISIYASGNSPPEIKITPFGNTLGFKEERPIKKNIKNFKLPTADSSKFSHLPKEEPETSIRRFSNKITYEIKMPGVKSIRDISIAQFENSIEIKALTKNKVFYKIIQVGLPIKKYNFTKEKLVLELDARD